jgi:DNA-binding PadR family transcriptional regulator
MEEEGLLTAEELNGKKVLSLTARGRRRRRRRK